MNCANCGKKIAATAAFCSHCGQAQQNPGTGQELEKIKKLVHRGNYAKALDGLQKLKAVDPANAEATCWWGHALFYSGHPEEAYGKYQEALGLDPSLWDATFQAASIAYTRQLFAEAVDYFQKLLAMKPKLQGHLLAAAFGGDENRFLANANLYLGLAHRELGDFASAFRRLETAAELDQSSPLAYGILGDLYSGRNDYKKAVHAYGQALERVTDLPSQVALHNDLGVAYFRNGSLAEATEEFKWVIHRDPKNQNAIYNLGVLFLKQGMPEGLRKEWKEFLKADDAAGILLGLTRSMVEAAKTETADQEPIGLVGGSAPMRQVFDLIKRAAGSNANVLILGENGTGKELVARAIHQASVRSQKPFVAINCGAVPEGLLESELFGYEKGAFTGAYAAKPGRFELAEGGTLFFDEIGDLNLSLQVKLLRVIQERTFERLGGTQTSHADVRIIAATHRDLRQKVAQGTFREDLFYRLYVIPLQIPPLRERKGDIPELAQHFLERFSRRNNKHFSSIHPEALEVLTNYDWPGNVRELENIIERAVALYDDNLVLPAYLQLDRNLERPERIAASEPVPSSDLAADPASALAQAERRQIVETLERVHYKLPRAAESLGISRVTLWRKMQKYQINLKTLV